ncbi:MAG: penicillin-binding protein 2, partial [Tannerellaceae bacterium]|nr:penicillin-binding protein 2 [Tannerellaceae bacterium]
EVLTTPLQICNLAASIANRGYFYTPHIVKSVENGQLASIYTEKRRPTIDANHYAYLAEGMRNAVTGGTCRRAALPDIAVCGKTGTSENPHGKDHSLFMGFAPYENPQVAISVFVENAGFGATYAVPIAKLMLQKYLKGTIQDSDQYLEESIINMVILPKNVL